MASLIVLVLGIILIGIVGPRISESLFPDAPDTEKMCQDVGGEMFKFYCIKDDRYLEEDEWKVK